MLRSIEFARNHGVRIHVRSSLSEERGNVVVGQEELMEQPIISGIAHDTSEAEVTISASPTGPASPPASSAPSPTWASTST